MPRVFISVLDSFGIGAASDANKFGDEKSDTFGHIADVWLKEKGRGLNIPNLSKYGLTNLYNKCNHMLPSGLKEEENPEGIYAYAASISTGKSTFCGHMEMAGSPIDYDLAYYPDGFSKEIIDRFLKATGLEGVLGNCTASGTEIIKELGEEHLKTGYPIIYTSADSVFQIAAHEKHFGLEKLYDACHKARDICDEYNIAVVIARPFLGEVSSDFKRTKNRHDYTIAPKYPTLLQALESEGRKVTAIGKINDIYGGKGISKYVSAAGIPALFGRMLEEMSVCPEGSLVFTNFVNFDMDFGHRRNPIGYGELLEYFDTRLPELSAYMKKGDIMIFTADHGCDPTFSGTDHTREYIPVLIIGSNEKGFKGKRETFADIGQTVAKHLGIKPIQFGESII